MWRKPRNRIPPSKLFNQMKRQVLCLIWRMNIRDLYLPPNSDQKLPKDLFLSSSWGVRRRNHFWSISSLIGVQALLPSKMTKISFPPKTRPWLLREFLIHVSLWILHQLRLRWMKQLSWLKRGPIKIINSLPSTKKHPPKSFWSQLKSKSKPRIWLQGLWVGRILPSK